MAWNDARPIIQTTREKRDTSSSEKRLERGKKKRERGTGGKTKRDGGFVGSRSPACERGWEGPENGRRSFVDGSPPGPDEHLPK